MSISKQKHPSSSPSSMQQQRPVHHPSKNLSQNEIQCLYDLLGDNFVTLATAVAQILYGFNHVWKKQACGVLCFVKDYHRRVYCFRLYNLRSKEVIYEEIIFVSLSLEKVLDLLYTFDGIKCKVGINFVDRIEAETFCKHFQEKQADRQKKMKIQQSKNTSMTVMMNGIKPPTNDIIKAPIPASTVNKKIKSKVPEDRKQKKHQRPYITGPVQSSFVHVIHVAHEESFVTDQAKKQLFEEVLTNMHMSPEEEIFIRRTIKDTNNGLEKLFTKSIREDNTQSQQVPNDAPELPPRTYKSIERNSPNHFPHRNIPIPSLIHPQTSQNRPQLQDTHNTSIDFGRLTPPVVPPRPARRTLETRQQQHSRTSPALPSPIPIDTQSCRMPPPPPPPPPPMPSDFLNQKPNPSPPMSVPEQLTNETSIPTLNSDRDQLHNAICSFNPVKLKPASQRPTAVVNPTENKSNLNTQRTLEENIREILDKRRMDIMGRNDEEDENESNDEEWDV